MLRSLRGCRGARALATKASSARALATKASSASWSPEWAKAGLGADTAAAGATLNRVMFVQCGFGCDQHGDRKLGATKAAVRAVRNAIEFNSIPGMVEIEGGRKNMLIHLKLGVPPDTFVDTDEVAKVFPYGRLLPIEVTAGGLSYGSGRVVSELGDEDDVALVVCAAVSIGYEAEGEGAERRVWRTDEGH